MGDDKISPGQGEGRHCVSGVLRQLKAEDWNVMWVTQRDGSGAPPLWAVDT